MTQEAVRLEAIAKRLEAIGRDGAGAVAYMNCGDWLSDAHFLLSLVSAYEVESLRANGWSVAVHNDYRQDGVLHTFWLFTKDGRAVKGEGRTDAEALAEVRRHVWRAGAPEPRANDA